MKNIKIMFITIIFVLCMWYLFNKFSVETFDDQNDKIINVYKEMIRKKDFPLPNITNEVTQFPVLIFDNFIDPDDCDYLIKCAEGNFIESEIVQEDNKVRSVDKNLRKSETFSFEKNQNQTVKKIEDKVSKILNVPLNKIEKLQITKYNKNNFFVGHYDFFGKSLEEGETDRAHTIIVYLNDLDENDGGATYFPNHKIKIYPFTPLKI